MNDATKMHPLPQYMRKRKQFIDIPILSDKNTEIERFVDSKFMRIGAFVC